MMELPDRLSGIMRLDPDAAAIHTPTASHPWSSVLSLVEDLNRNLESAAVPPGGTVGILLRNRPAHVAALLGVVSGRRCVVSFSPLLADRVIRDQIGTTHCHVMLAGMEDWARREIEDSVRRSGVLGLEMSSELTNPLRVRVPGRVRRPTGGTMAPGVVATVLTSGTTGPPKRVAITQADLEAALVAASNHAGVAEDPVGERLRLRRAVSIVSMPLSHISGLWGVISAAAGGRQLAILERFDPWQWAAMVRAHKPAVANLQPTPLRMVLDVEIPRDWLESLRAVLVGTAPLDPAVADEFTATYGVPTLTMYGATEFAGAVAAWTLTDYRQYWADKRGSVGRAYPGAELRVVDPSTGSPVAADCTGVLEVRLRSRGNNDWVRTTDYAHLDGDGFLWVEGRADNAINRGGFKVLPATIERALRAHPGVRDAVAIGMPDRRLGQIPMAAVVARPEADVDEAELIRWCRDRLAPYEVPLHVAVISELPLTASMKVDVLQLRRSFARGGGGGGP
jgi:acyl-CoA synthetase (AMP-forming)/AMP-acid ligase II